ncbi:hypothetical protein CIHG_08201 [Coccidioides immitis H538.4]|uniref:Uncharacterized protein n=3 Tax=Coccidioides immitis TaxID=5501 RepID=A0A0J8TZL2_COCIT|nr:hypothetical protein CIRG_04270 [Coccidioides immitis RMSCC 2394]KMU79432.1 hypothetical protein CISG_07863 [Coccidioides immitis RMSCC 3703]KMU90391.1 hypothetical protein CIHG_08201 [Coccidioides immitis H538.4]
MKFVSAFIATIIAARTLGLDIPECANPILDAMFQFSTAVFVYFRPNAAEVLPLVNVETHQMTRKVRHFWDNKSFFGVFVKISILWAGMAKKNQSRIAAVHPHAAKQRRTWPKILEDSFKYSAPKPGCYREPKLRMRISRSQNTRLSPTSHDRALKKEAT